MSRRSPAPSSNLELSHPAAGADDDSSRANFSRATAAPGARSLLTGILLILGCLWLTLPAAADWQAGLAALKARDLDRAEAEFRAVIAEKPDWYGGYRMLGQTLLDANRPDEAIIQLEKATELQPADVGGRYALGRAAMLAQSYRLAFDTLEGDRPEGLNETQWLAWLRYRAEAARAVSEVPRALADLRQIVDLGGGDAESLYLLGHLTLQQGNADGALEPLTDARRLAKADGKKEIEGKALRLALGIRHSQATAQEVERHAAACSALIADARRLIELERSAENLRRAGKIMGCAGQAADAAELLRAAVRAGDDEWRTELHLARQLSFADRPGEAEKVLKKLLASNLGPDDASPVHELYGYILERQKRFDEAIAQYTAAGSPTHVARAEQSRQIHQDNLASERKAEDMRRLEIELEKLKKEAEKIGSGSLP